MSSSTGWPCYISNKAMQGPYDGRFKHLAEDFSLLLLRLLNLLEPGSEAHPLHLLRELQLDPVQVDHVYRIGDKSIVHFEAISSWNAKRVPRLALYRFLLKQKFELPVASYLVFMAEKYAPRSLPKRLVYEEDDGFRHRDPVPCDEAVGDRCWSCFRERE